MAVDIGKPGFPEEDGTLLAGVTKVPKKVKISVFFFFSTLKPNPNCLSSSVGKSGQRNSTVLRFPANPMPERQQNAIFLCQWSLTSVNWHTIHPHSGQNQGKNSRPGLAHGTWNVLPEECKRAKIQILGLSALRFDSFAFSQMGFRLAFLGIGRLRHLRW